jgi:hypothetical protein
LTDYGTSELRTRKRRATTREDLPLDGAAVLLGREYIDHEQFDTLGRITELLRRVARAWGGKDGSVQGLWTALLAASSRTRVPATTVPLGSDSARWRLARVLQRLNGSRDLVIELAEGRTPPIVIRAIERTLTRGDTVDLERLRAGLDRLVERH